MRQKIGSETNGSINLGDLKSGANGDISQKVEDWYEGLPAGRQALVRGIAGRLDGRPDTIIHYKLDKQIKYRWNMTIGGEVGINKRLQFRAEVGFLGRKQLIAGFNYRFGLFPAWKDDTPGKKPDITPLRSQTQADSTSKVLQ